MRLCLAAIVLCAGSAAPAQEQVYPIYTGDDLDEAMQGVGRQFELLTATIASGDFEAAKVRVTRAREQLSPTISFWRNHRRDDAVRMVRDATGRLDDLDAALSEAAIDAAAVAASARAVDAACQACHAVYREPDPSGDAFRLKPGAVD